VKKVRGGKFGNEKEQNFGLHLFFENNSKH
jgi:hypothetical protein